MATSSRGRFATTDAATTATTAELATASHGVATTSRAGPTTGFRTRRERTGARAG